MIRKEIQTIPRHRPLTLKHQITVLENFKHIIVGSTMGFYDHSSNKIKQNSQALQESIFNR